METSKFISKFFAIAFLSMVASWLLVGCGTTVPKAQKGGSATYNGAPTPALTVSQPENSQAQTTSTYEREVIPYNWTNLITGTNWAMMKEKFSTTFGEHQTDEARGAWGTVAKCATVLKSMNIVIWSGIALVLASLAMIYFQAKFPLVFTPGLKLIALTFLTGVLLIALPSMTQNQSVIMMALIGGVAVVMAYIFGKKFDQSQNNLTPVTVTGETKTKTKDKE